MIEGHNTPKEQIMKQFGVKVVDKENPEVYVCIDLAREKRLCVEMGLYFNARNPCNYLSEHQDDVQVNMHFNHREYSLFVIDQHRQRLFDDIARAKTMGATYAVTHTFVGAMTPRPEYRPRLLERLALQAKLLDSWLAEADFEIYLENTYHSIEFYRGLFDRFDAEGIEHINFCYDIGHAKVWSRDGFEEWMAFLSDLRNNGRKLHFHLHANRGLADEHLSFVEAEELGAIAADGAFSDQDYFEMLRRIFTEFPEARKIFEVKNSFAFENLKLLEQEGILGL